MKEAYLMINGKRIDLTPEQVELIEKDEKKSPFERVKDGKYYYIGSNGKVVEVADYSCLVSDVFYKNANYCADRKMMEQRALHETLDRLLWRFAEENNDDEIWDGRFHYYVYLHQQSNLFEVGRNDAHKKLAIYFDTVKTAERAIKEIVEPFMKEHPEFVW